MMKYRMRIIKLLAAMALPCVSAASVADAVTYYCPRANVAIQGDVTGASKGLSFAIKGDTRSSFPSTLVDASTPSSSSGKLTLTMKECSSWRFLCKEVTQQLENGKTLEYMLVVPRRIHDRKVYDYRDVHIVTRRPAVWFANNKHQFGTVTIWQTIDGKEVPMELTIEATRGLVFWDGVRFSSNDIMIGQMCVLETKNGIFKEAKVHTK